MRRSVFALAIGIAFTLGETWSVVFGTKEEGPRYQATDLQQALKTIRESKFVDLTHAFEPNIPHWHGLPNEERETLYHYDKGKGTRGDGFLIHRYNLAGQWGTHVDPPAHFIRGLRTVDQIDVREMVLPLVVLDLHDAATKDPDVTVSMNDVRAWEKKHGQVPKEAFVALRTDWSKRWPDAKKMQNADERGVAHYPGWSAEVLKYVLKECKVTAIGHETTDTDPGLATSKEDYSLETYVLSQDKYQIEILANLDKVPESGGIAVVSFPKPKGGSGFPARVFAIVP
ncbi:MAG: cyclase family protein [Gemmataceae bacterium]